MMTMMMMMNLILLHQMTRFVLTKKNTFLFYSSISLLVLSRIEGRGGSKEDKRGAPGCICREEIKELVFSACLVDWAAALLFIVCCVFSTLEEPALIAKSSIILDIKPVGLVQRNNTSSSSSTVLCMSIVLYCLLCVRPGYVKV